MALILICSVSVPLSLHDCVITICLSLLLLSAATTTHPTNCYSTPKCLHWQVNAILSSNPARITLKQFKRLLFPIPVAAQTLGLANTASNRVPQNNCWLYPKVKDRTKIQDYYIFGFWISDFCIENFKLPGQRAMGLPKNRVPCFGTCCNPILQEWLRCDTKDSRKCCVHSSIILYLPFPAK